jgi:hypothetical protein
MNMNLNIHLLRLKSASSYTPFTFVPYALPLGACKQKKKIPLRRTSVVHPKRREYASFLKATDRKKKAYESSSMRDRRSLFLAEP